MSVRLILMMGRGSDPSDATRAARAAIADARARAAVPALDDGGAGARWRVTVAVPDPSAVDPAALVPDAPDGAEIVLATGGLAVWGGAFDGPQHVMAAAAVELFLPPRDATPTA